MNVSKEERKLQEAGWTGVLVGEGVVSARMRVAGVTVAIEAKGAGGKLLLPGRGVELGLATRKREWPTPGEALLWLAEEDLRQRGL